MVLPSRFNDGLEMVPVFVNRYFTGGWRVADSSLDLTPNVEPCSPACQAQILLVEKAAKVSAAVTVAQADAAIRNRALTLSSVITVSLLYAHIAFIYMGRVLPVPDIMWAVVLCPWLGAGGGKVAEMLDRYMARGK